MTDLVGVVAVPVKRNYLRHLAPRTSDLSWATRGVVTFMRLGRVRC